MSLNSEKYTSILKGLHNAVALDYHYEKKQIFWAEVLLDSIRVANVNGTNINGKRETPFLKVFNSVLHHNFIIYLRLFSSRCYQMGTELTSWSFSGLDP